MPTSKNFLTEKFGSQARSLDKHCSQFIIMEELAARVTD
jgi:hypothetical protein